MLVLATDPYSRWFLDLPRADANAIDRVVQLLRLRGVALGYPHSSAVLGWKYAIRELRVQSGGKPFRIFYAFDPGRDVLLILGGEKAGKKKFYEDMQAPVEALWAAYLVAHAAARAAEDEKRKREHAKGKAKKK